MNIEPLDQAWNFDPEYHRFAGLVGLDPHKRQDYKMAEKLYFIVEQLGGKSLTDKLSRLEKARKGLGTNQTGELLVNQLWQSMRLKSDIIMEREQEKTVLREEAKEKKAQAEQLAKEMIKKVQDEIVETKKQTAELKSMNYKKQISIEKAERIKLETLYKEQTGKEFNYATA